MRTSHRLAFVAAAVVLQATGLLLGFLSLRIPEPHRPRDAQGCLDLSGAPLLSTFLLGWFAFVLACASVFCLVKAWPPRSALVGRLAVAVLGVAACVGLYIVAQAPIQLHEDAVPLPRHCPI